jgi:hypothetical protein
MPIASESTCEFTKDLPYFEKSLRPGVFQSESMKQAILDPYCEPVVDPSSLRKVIP